MEQGKILTYQLPNIRCTNCNKPIAHLYDTYKEYLDLKLKPIEIYEILKLKRVCCRTEIAFAHVITITKPDEYKILGIEEKETCVFKDKAKLKPLVIQKANKKIECPYKSGMPISIMIGTKTKALNDELWVNYVKESIYMAQ